MFANEPKNFDGSIQKICFRQLSPRRITIYLNKVSPTKNDDIKTPVTTWPSLRRPGLKFWSHQNFEKFRFRQNETKMKTKKVAFRTNRFPPKNKNSRFRVFRKKKPEQQNFSGPKFFVSVSWNEKLDEASNALASTFRFCGFLTKKKLSSSTLVVNYHWLREPKYR